MTAPFVDTGLAADTWLERTGRLREEIRPALERDLTPLLADAERQRRFPRHAVAALGQRGLLERRWTGGAHGDLALGFVLAQELGRAGLGGLGVGVSLHTEAVCSILHRFARTAYVTSVLDKALAGGAVGCLATSEEHVGSDLAAVSTRLTRTVEGWTVDGTKWFVSPGGAADFLIVLGRAEEDLALVVVPRSGFTVLKRLQTSGMRSLETARLRVRAIVPHDAVLVSPGLALPAVTWGLTHERLAIAAQLYGGMELALALATTHAMKRRQFGCPLLEHQEIRLRLADLTARTAILGDAVETVARRIDRDGALHAREVAGLKVRAARLGEQVIGECLHVFGGRGYLEDETPLARLCRDVRVGRLGAGSDEMMLEIVASGLHADDELYERWVTT